ncbi:uncharacterized protein LOC124287168 isoform X2 [Haliotis rubra]|uniref:uncharacterized protein LOC124287168 isoform X2 n=1 Tax=Haliotis rubra TaxID=36100 RepID=UPI001EE624BA|nr:uncharacterized protein LOC124287168 isoform X2 [Haliotis rubra]
MGRLVVVAVVCFVVVSGTVHDDTEVSELREEVKELKQILQHSGITRRETDEEITIGKRGMYSRRGVEADVRKIYNEVRELKTMLTRVEEGVTEQKACLRDQSDLVENIRNYCVGGGTSTSTAAPSTANVIPTTGVPDKKPPPPGLFLVGTTRTTVELVITPPPNYGDRGVTWYQVRHTTSGSDVNYDVKGELMDPRHFLLTGLMPDTQYTILVRAGYDAEYGETANVTATTLRRTPPVTRFVVNGSLTLPVVVHAGSRRQNGPDLLVLASPLIDHTEHRG